MEVREVARRIIPVGSGSQKEQTPEILLMIVPVTYQSETLL